ncbi:hypothetical protein BRC81_07715 [Halobacteriales archaeon QS_1_68_20]|nr:MAG: hypothetical protein BRC81_07715 [Halobacteriales archaeon QS_1_68_20]
MASPLAIAGTFLATAVFFAATLHVAVRWVVGEGPLRKAAMAGPAAAAAVLVLQSVSLPNVAVLAGAAMVDLFAIAVVYELGTRRTALLTLAHLVITVALSFALANLWLSLAA